MELSGNPPARVLYGSNTFFLGQTRLDGKGAGDDERRGETLVIRSSETAYLPAIFAL